MTFPKITVPVANEFFKPVGVQITEHFLGYYEAEVAGKTHSNERLGFLVAELMTTYFHSPEPRQSPDAPSCASTHHHAGIDLPFDSDQREPDFDEWQYLSEKRHTDAGIL